MRNKMNGERIMISNELKEELKEKKNLVAVVIFSLILFIFTLILERTQIAS